MITPGLGIGALGLVRSTHALHGQAGPSLSRVAARRESGLGVSAGQCRGLGGVSHPPMARGHTGRRVDAAVCPRPSRAGHGRHRKNLVLSIGLVAGLGAALSAQTPSSKRGSMGQQTIQSIRVTVIGCVAHGTASGRYLLTDAILSGDDIPSTSGTAGTLGSGKDLSFENSPSYDLIGGDLTAQVGHTVEITGITSDAKLNGRATLTVAIGWSTHERATLTVRSVRMIAAMCP